MEPNLSCLHPNPGWGDICSKEIVGPAIPNTNLSVGKHCILELYDCDQNKLNDEAFLRTTITTAAKSAGAQLLNLITHRFEPYGVTGLALLAESHISIHTWPENGYAAVDVFTCGDQSMPEKACEILKRELLAENFSLTSFKRKIPENIMHGLRNPRPDKSKIF